ncbi:DUF4198 domain-containing protein [Sphingobium boeckii]|uniref:Putative GH25 family protein n=1 Tax=Sphingobium boeckii TaxID=1082345 RepID=A0A7W9ECV1_9SPHN|nr:DUF4198 domain-containing protein [Sphingobium boeckii]MBB5684437.1 putative GH25 family protein [Sphingobium boeckii]
MKTRILRTAAGIALAAVLALPAGVQAHRQWMLPSATVLSGNDVWVSVDAAVSNDLFYFEHTAANVDNVKAWAPDGTEVKIENAFKSRYRSTFDVHLTQKGTYRIANVSDGVSGSYTLNGKEERLPRGTTPENLASKIPAGATDIQTAESNNRNEIFVTSGEPTTTIFKPTGKGIELVPVSHPNDLVSGEAATFQFLLDGKPAANLGVTIIPGGIRYRDQLNQIDAKTDKDGKITVTWPEPGMYWLNASIGGGREGGGAGGPGGPGGPGGAAAGTPGAPPAAAPRPAGPPQRRASYITTLEVLAL